MIFAKDFGRNQENIISSELNEKGEGRSAKPTFLDSEDKHKSIESV